MPTLRRTALFHCAPALVLCTSLSAAPPALAKKRGAHPDHSGAPKQHARKSSRATPARSSSEESRAERERRLLRECRGLPNAGACLGYAS